MAEDDDRSFSELAAAVAESRARFALDRDCVAKLISPYLKASYRELTEEVSKLMGEEPWLVGAALLKLAKGPEIEPLRAMEVAELALQAIECARLPERFSRSRLAEAEMLKGEGLRRLGKFGQSGTVFARAARYLKSAGDPNQSGVYCRYLAELRVDQDRTEEALPLLGEAASLFGEVGQIDEQAEALLRRANLNLGLERLDSALADFRAADSLAQNGLRPDVEDKRRAVQATILSEARGCAEPVADRVLTPSRLKLTKARLEAARRELLDLGEVWYAALVNLNLANLYLVERRRSPELDNLVETGLRPLSRSQGFPREVRAALRRFCAAIEDGTASAGLAWDLRRYIEECGTERDKPRKKASAAGSSRGELKTSNVKNGFW